MWARWGWGRFKTRLERIKNKVEEQRTRCEGGLVNNWNEMGEPKQFYKTLNFQKETSAQVFSCEFCEIFRITSFVEHLWMAASLVDQNIY